MSETILKLEHVTKVYGNGKVANYDINIDFKASADIVVSDDLEDDDSIYENE